MSLELTCSTWCGTAMQSPDSHQTGHSHPTVGLVEREEVVISNLKQDVRVRHEGLVRCPLRVHIGGTHVVEMHAIEMHRDERHVLGMHDIETNVSEHCLVSGMHLDEMLLEETHTRRCMRLRADLWRDA
uniref:Uncharacterized protein n=1 Tax=Cannabis sativa TaxID=3483 RepID=A0A803PJR6_CANSA